MSDRDFPINISTFRAKLRECDIEDSFDKSARDRYETVLLSALKIAPNSSRLLSMVADLRSLDQIGCDESIRRLHEAIRADPLSPHPYESLGRISLFKADFEAAIEWFRMSIDAEENVPAYLGLALALKEAGYADEASEAIKSSRHFVAQLTDEICSLEADFAVRDAGV